MTPAPNHDAVETFITDLNNLHEQKGKKLTIEDVASLLDNFDGHAFSGLIMGLQKISGKMASIKLALAEDPDSINEQKIPDANDILQDVVRSTEEAANKIMDAAEQIQGHAMELPEAQQQPIMEGVTQIFEASNFQDLTGQRLNNVMSGLVEIDEMVRTLLDAVSEHVDIEAVAPRKEKSHEKSLMNGPQSMDTAPNQDDIDKLFDSL